MIAAIAIIAEQRIREAMDRGDFNDLPCKGKPLDLEEDANIPPELRMAWKLLKNGGYLDDARAEDFRESPANLEAMLAGNHDERLKLRQMLKLQVTQARMAGLGKRDLNLDAEPEYYEKIVERISVSGAGENK